jgi:hypothetical protein
VRSRFQTPFSLPAEVSYSGRPWISKRRSERPSCCAHRFIFQLSPRPSCVPRSLARPSQRASFATAPAWHLLLLLHRSPAAAAVDASPRRPRVRLLRQSRIRRIRRTCTSGMTPLEARRRSVGACRRCGLRQRNPRSSQQQRSRGSHVPRPTSVPCCPPSRPTCRTRRRSKRARSLSCERIF